MIELSLSKLVLIGIVTLVVVGPDKLPDLARKAGALFSRSRRWMDSVRSDIGRYSNLDGLNDIEQTVREATQDIHRNLPGIDLSAGPRNEQLAIGANSLIPADAHAARVRRFRLTKMEKASIAVGSRPSKNARTACNRKAGNESTIHPFY